MRIGLVCVNYNNSLITEKLINSIDESCNLTNVEIHIVIIDNSNNLEIDTNKYNVNITIIQSENIGYFPALNLGLRFIKRKSKLNFIIIGNNDLVFNQSFFLVLLHNQEYLNRFLVISPRITKENGQEQNPHVINDMSNLRLIYLKFIYSNRFFYKYVRLIIQLLIPQKHLRKDELNYKKSQYISQGHGSCYILTNKYFEKYNLPEYTNLYGEEFFLSYQLSQIGTSVYFFHELSVYHDEHSSTNKMLSKKLFKLKKEAFVKEIKLRKVCKK